jgi:threonine/homoserine/homoserine lactone efflux protein
MWIIAMATTMVALYGSPGPNNFLVFHAAFAGGVRAAALLSVGILLGYNMLLAAVLVGLVGAFESASSVWVVLRLLACGLLAWVAIRLVRSAGAAEEGHPVVAPLRPTQGMVFQLVNPKSWAVAIAVAGAYGGTAGEVGLGAWVVVLTSASVGVFTLSSWSALGLVARRYRMRSSIRTAVTRILGLLLLVTAGWIALGP